MKKATLLLVMVTAFLLNNSYAQVTTKGGSTPTEKTDKGDKKDKVQSEMSNDAASTAKEWTTKYANKLEDLKTKYKGMENPNADAAKSEKDELTKQRFKDYSNVLSKEQMQKFKDYRQTKKGEEGAEADKAGKKDDVKEKYKNATPEEKEKMKEELKEKKDKKASKE